MVGHYYMINILNIFGVTDLLARICTAAEVKFYLDSYFSSSASSKRTNYLKPNKNCNLSSWVSGCEPGWACSAGKGQKVDYKNAKVMPSRTINCLPCCEGFFCPHGITCMIRKSSFPTHPFLLQFHF